MFVNVRDDFISILSRARAAAHEYTPPPDPASQMLYLNLYTVYTLLEGFISLSHLEIFIELPTSEHRSMAVVTLKLRFLFCT